MRHIILSDTEGDFFPENSFSHQGGMSDILLTAFT